jgi:hypothetical protein
MTTPPGRKRPHCHTCGAPMSGHKRENFKPVCPDGRSTSPGASPGPRRSPRSVPHVVIPPYTHPTMKAKRERPPSPTPTVLNDEMTKGEETDEQEGVGMTSTSTIPLPPSSSFHSFIHSFGLDRPLASLFVSPKSRANAVQRHAGEMGLFSGAVYKPPRIKEEESERWVVMGPDPGAVDRLLDSQKKEAERQFRLGRRMPGGGTQIEEKVAEHGKHWAGFLQLTMASALGGLVVFFCLSRL